MTRCAVYDLLVDDAVVYVGSTTTPKTRLHVHRCRKEFKAARLRISAWYGSVLRAQISESQRIAALRPKYNVACNPEILANKQDARKSAILDEWRSDLDAGMPTTLANSKCERRLRQLSRVSKQTVRNHFPRDKRDMLAKRGPTKAQREKYT